MGVSQPRALHSRFHGEKRQGMCQDAYHFVRPVFFDQQQQQQQQHFIYSLLLIVDALKISIPKI